MMALPTDPNSPTGLGCWMSLGDRYFNLVMACSGISILLGIFNFYELRRYPFSQVELENFSQASTINCQSGENAENLIFDDYSVYHKAVFFNRPKTDRVNDIQCTDNVRPISIIG